MKSEECDKVPTIKNKYVLGKKTKKNPEAKVIKR